MDLLPVIVKNYNEKTIHTAVSSEPAAVEDNDYLSKYLLRERNTAKMWRNAAQHRVQRKTLTPNQEVYVPEKRGRRGFRRAYSEKMQIEPRRVVEVLREGRAVRTDDNIVYPTRTVVPRVPPPPPAPRYRRRAKGPIR